MQDLSFHFTNQVFQFHNMSFSVMVYTFRNAYSLNPASTVIEEDGVLCAHCHDLLWAGGQEHTSGQVSINAEEVENGIRVSIYAELSDSQEEIRCVKLSLYGIIRSRIINLIDARPRSIPASGLILKYPEGWRDVGTPLLIMEGPGMEYTYLKSLDGRVREKRFAFIPEDDDRMTVELIYEEQATHMTNRLHVPAWEVGVAGSREEIYRPHMELTEKAYGMEPWETRKDVPDWAREIALVAAIHCQHWTGYIFNTYEAVLNNLRLLCEKIEGKRILAYLPGWEGRYYWKYGNYCPDERMGGIDGFRKLCDGARELGVHLMPMFGINIVGCHVENYEQWGAPCEMRSAAGSTYGGSVDWDGSRHYDHGSNRNLNPGAPKWQNRLYELVTSLMDTYGFSAAFFDIAAVWMNDPNYDVYTGIRELTERLKKHNPDMLISGEAWYDGLAACIPLLQCGHTDGVLHWHDEAYAPMFDTYARNFGHLCLGDPSQFSTGVHELGTNQQWRAPLRKGIIPTLTVVEGTLDKSPDRVSLIINDSLEYARRFLS